MVLLLRKKEKKGLSILSRQLKFVGAVLEEKVWTEGKKDQFAVFSWLSKL
jgi:hypothetical protein